MMATSALLLKKVLIAASVVNRRRRETPLSGKIDIGGATGNLLAAILSHHRKPRGILFDLPHVVSSHDLLLGPARDLGDRNRRIRIAIPPGTALSPPG